MAVLRTNENPMGIRVFNPNGFMCPHLANLSMIGQKAGLLYRQNAMKKIDAPEIHPFPNYSIFHQISL